MKIRNTLRRNAAAIAVAGTLSALGVGGLMAAHADDSSPRVSQQDKGDGDGEQNDATEVEGDGETNDDATDQGPDANPNEPGHQDASDARGDEGDGDGEQNDATEVEGDGETNDDATDQGPDANPNEPGHQDASDN